MRASGVHNFKHQMVAKVISGKDIKGALNYNEVKVTGGKAALIHASGFMKDTHALSFYDKLHRFTALHELNERATTNTFHISLNFDPSEQFNSERLSSIASTYMEKVGLGNQPYLVYEHKDAAHPHVHIVTTIIQPNGKRIPTHNFGKLKSEPARKEIEIEFGLIKASSKVKNALDVIPSSEIKKAVYGKSVTRRSISNIVRAVTGSYKYTSLPELNAALRQYNVTADRGTEKSRMFAKKGLVYGLLDEKGKRVGIPVKASSIFGKPTLTFLERQFKLGDISRQRNREPLKKIIDGVLSSANVRTKKDFISALEAKGIVVLFRANAEGRTYGVTFVDNNTRSVFNGSVLGKEYSAAPILAKLNSTEEIVSKSRGSVSKTKPEAEAPAHSGNDTTSVIKGLITSEMFDPRMPQVSLGLRKKKRKRKSRRL